MKIEEIQKYLNSRLRRSCNGEGYKSFDPELARDFAEAFAEIAGWKGKSYSIDTLPENNIKNVLEGFVEKMLEPIQYSNLSICQEVLDFLVEEEDSYWSKQRNIQNDLESNLSLKDALFMSDILYSIIFMKIVLANTENGINDELRAKAEVIIDLFERSNFYALCFTEDTCHILPDPEMIICNGRSLFHSTEGPAIVFAGSKMYYVNGRKVESDFYEKCLEGKITKEDFISERNAENRAIMYAVIGANKMCHILGAKEVGKRKVKHSVMAASTESDVEELPLYKAQIEGKTFAWVQFTCPTTGTKYMIGCSPDNEDPVQAAASQSPIFSADEYGGFTART